MGTSEKNEFTLGKAVLEESSLHIVSKKPETQRKGLLPDKKEDEESQFKKSKMDVRELEVQARVSRAEMLKQNDNELHRLKMRERELRVGIAELEREKAKVELKRAQEENERQREHFKKEQDFLNEKRAIELSLLKKT